MTTAAHVTRNPSLVANAALRHAVFSRVLELLPIATYGQARKFIANLKLCSDAEPAAVDLTMMRFLNLRVTPDIGIATNYRWRTRDEIDDDLNAKFGGHLAEVPGFIRSGDGWRLDLPRNAAVYGYRTNVRRVAGLLIAPLDRLDSFWLLSSAVRGGPKATPLTPADREFFRK